MLTFASIEDADSSVSSIVDLVVPQDRIAVSFDPHPSHGVIEDLVLLNDPQPTVIHQDASILATPDLVLLYEWIASRPDTDKIYVTFEQTRPSFLEGTCGQQTMPAFSNTKTLDATILDVRKQHKVKRSGANIRLVIHTQHHFNRNTFTDLQAFLQSWNQPVAIPKPVIYLYKDVTGWGFFTAATYGTRCPAHEYGTPPSVSCRIHAPGIEFHTLQPWKTRIPLRVYYMRLEYF